MPVPLPQLPSEVWNYIFGFLSAVDKFSVRAACKYFNELVDHGSLWKDWTVVLVFRKGCYNERFWISLRRRKITQAVVRRANAKDWEWLARSLPGLTTLVVDLGSQDALDRVKHFPRLRHLAVRHSRAPLHLHAGTVSQPLQLNHLSLCNVQTDGSLISFLSQFAHLTSLICHQTKILSECGWTINPILNCLPKLKHLSLSLAGIPHLRHSDPRLTGEDGTSALSSLELLGVINYSLPEDMMRQIPNLQTLSVFHNLHDQEMTLELLPLRLAQWLRDLPRLSTLIVAKGPRVGEYLHRIPATVTTLVLCGVQISSMELTAMATQLPNLLHLHIDPWPSHLGALTAQIPHLFPKLKSLKLRHEHVPEEAFLSLHKLKDLKTLKILDCSPRLPQLIDKLRALSDWRFQVVSTPSQRDALLCPCVCDIH